MTKVEKNLFRERVEGQYPNLRLVCPRGTGIWVEKNQSQPYISARTNPEPPNQPWPPPTLSELHPEKSRTLRISSQEGVPTAGRQVCGDQPLVLSTLELCPSAGNISHTPGDDEITTPQMPGQAGRQGLLAEYSTFQLRRLPEGGEKRQIRCGSPPGGGRPKLF